MKSFYKTSYSCATKRERDGNHAAFTARNSKVQIQGVLFLIRLKKN